MLTPFALAGDVVRLEPLTPDHVAGLVAAAAEGRDGYAFTVVPDGPAAAAAYVRSALADQARGDTLPFAVRRLADDRIVGSTRFLDLGVLGGPAGWSPSGAADLPTDVLAPTVGEVGSTWYAASSQRTAVNTACKLLLLGHAFEVWRSERITFKTDARNTRSRAAIERLGAAFEGVRRVHATASDGALRDTAYYSVLRAEWPDVRTRLESRLRAG